MSPRDPGICGISLNSVNLLYCFRLVTYFFLLDTCLSVTALAEREKPQNQSLEIQFIKFINVDGAYNLNLCGL